MKRLHISFEFGHSVAFSAICRADQLPTVMELGLDCMQAVVRERVAECLPNVREAYMSEFSMKVVVRNIQG